MFIIFYICYLSQNIHSSMQKWFFKLVLIFIPYYTLLSQDNKISPDALLIQARKEAFENKDYSAAISLLKQALRVSPDYTDLSVFLGRVYTWDSQPDSARIIFNSLMQKEVENEDFFLAYASLEYWNDQEEKALEILGKGLAYNPKSEDLLILASKIYYSIDQIDKAENSLSELLTLNPKNTEAREFYSRIRDLTHLNALGITYNYVHFDKQFSDDWHIVGISYKRRTSLGSVIFRTNLANKFGDNGIQFEAEAYPRLSKILYMYIGAGYSNNVGIFPKFRSGLSLYANLPASFEGEIGIRQLYFNNNLIMYTGSVGKYYQNFWFNLRTFITPDNRNISHSYTGTVRYYTKGANDYIGFQIGTGISPEGNRNNLLEFTEFKMKTFKVGLDYNFTFGKRNQFSVSGTYFNQEYRPGTSGNQIDINLGYIRNF